MKKAAHPPSASLSPADFRAGALLTQALVKVAAEHAKECDASEAVVIAALVSALGCVAASVARTNGYDLTDFQAFVANHFMHVFESECQRVVYH